MRYHYNELNFIDREVNKIPDPEIVALNNEIALKIAPLKSAAEYLDSQIKTATQTRNGLEIIESESFEKEISDLSAEITKKQNALFELQDKIEVHNFLEVPFIYDDADVPFVESDDDLDEFYDNEINVFNYKIIDGEIQKINTQFHRYLIDENKKIIGYKGMSRWMTEVPSDEIWSDTFYKIQNPIEEPIYKVNSKGNIVKI